jgi:hypothetical protein
VLIALVLRTIVIIHTNTTSSALSAGFAVCKISLDLFPLPDQFDSSPVVHGLSCVHPRETTARWVKLDQRTAEVPSPASGDSGCLAVQQT